MKLTSARKKIKGEIFTSSSSDSSSELEELLSGLPFFEPLLAAGVTGLAEGFFAGSLINKKRKIIRMRQMETSLSWDSDVIPRQRRNRRCYHLKTRV
jgi:hypothetical protein